MSQDRAAVGLLVRQFAEIQRTIHRAGVPDRLPATVDRMCSKIAEVDVVSDAERSMSFTNCRAARPCCTVISTRATSSLDRPGSSSSIGSTHRSETRPLTSCDRAC